MIRFYERNEEWARGKGWGSILGRREVNTKILRDAALGKIPGVLLTCCN